MHHYKVHTHRDNTITITRSAAGIRKKKLERAAKREALLNEGSNEEEVAALITGTSNISALFRAMLVYIHFNWTMSDDDRVLGIESAKTIDSVFTRIAKHALSLEDLREMIGDRTIDQALALADDDRLRYRIELVFRAM